MNTLIEKVYLELRDRIITSDLRGGLKLKIEPLRDELSISSSTLREALYRLINDNLVVAKQQRGFYVTEISLQDFDDLIACLRTCLPALVARNAERADEESELQVIAALHRLSRKLQDLGDSGSPQSSAVIANVASYADELLIAISSSPEVSRDSLVCQRWLLEWRRYRYLIHDTPSLFQFLLGVTTLQEMANAFIVGDGEAAQYFTGELIGIYQNEQLRRRIASF